MLSGQVLKVVATDPRRSAIFRRFPGRPGNTLIDQSANGEFVLLRRRKIAPVCSGRSRAQDGRAQSAQNRRFHLRVVGLPGFEGLTQRRQTLATGAILVLRQTVATPRFRASGCSCVHCWQADCETGRSCRNGAPPRLSGVIHRCERDGHAQHLPASPSRTPLLNPVPALLPSRAAAGCRTPLAPPPRPVRCHHRRTADGSG